ncbi:MAG: 2-oxoacid:acceptor oxidoreductase subunit alpha [Halobacteriota archaeon]|nr:2-oxoacid:acceptor oxidoreductase subunit alpha [Halobacteriota archaeon]
MNEPTYQFIQGNEAITEGAIAGGCRFFAGYPITPSTEILERMAYRLPDVGGVFIQMEDELASIGSAIGASWTGRKAMTATSGPGFSLMQENIGFAIMTETPVVIVDMQRGGPSTGQPTMPSQGDTMQARWGTHGDHSIITLAPSSVQECYDLAIDAFNLAEKYRTPVIILSDAMTAHMRERVTIKEDPKIVTRATFRDGNVSFPFESVGLVPPFPVFGHGNRAHITGLTHNIVGYPKPSDFEVQEDLLRRIIDKIDLNRDEICKTQIINPEAKVFIVAYGPPSRAAQQVVRENEDIGLLRLITLWPFPEEDMMKVAGDARGVLVLEMNEGQMVREVERFSRRVGCDRIEFFSKVGGEVHTPQEILSRIQKMGMI